MITTSEFHKIIQLIIKDYTITQCRRWVRDALPKDENAKERSGYVRKFSLEDALSVYVFGYLIYHKKLDTQRARAIVDNIRVWLKDNFAPVDSFHERHRIPGWELYAIVHKDLQTIVIQAKVIRKTETTSHDRKAIVNRNYNYKQEGEVELVTLIRNGVREKSQPVSFFDCLEEAANFDVVIPIEQLAWAISTSYKEFCSSK